MNKKRTPCIRTPIFLRALFSNELVEDSFVNFVAYHLRCIGGSMNFTFVKLVQEEELTLDVFYEETRSVGRSIHCPANTLFLTDKKSLFIYLDEDGDGLIYLPKDRKWEEIELELGLAPIEGNTLYLDKPDDHLFSVKYGGDRYYVLCGD